MRQAFCDCCGAPSEAGGNLMFMLPRDRRRYKVVIAITDDTGKRNADVCAVCAGTLEGFLYRWVSGEG
jgi:hypothetical protein